MSDYFSDCCFLFTSLNLTLISPVTSMEWRRVSIWKMLHPLLATNSGVKTMIKRLLCSTLRAKSSMQAGRKTISAQIELESDVKIKICLGTCRRSSLKSMKSECVPIIVSNAVYSSFVIIAYTKNSLLFYIILCILYIGIAVTSHCNRIKQG